MMRVILIDVHTLLDFLLTLFSEWLCSPFLESTPVCGATMPASINSPLAAVLIRKLWRLSEDRNGFWEIMRNEYFQKYVASATDEHNTAMSS